MAGLAALLAPAAAEAAPKASTAATKAPVITKVTPKSSSIGKTIRVHGRYFRTGKGRNSVVFKRDGAKAVFVKADLATTKVLTVKLPATLEKFLLVRGGAPQPTRFRIRVLSSKLGKRFTTVRNSPVIGPEVKAPPKPSETSPSNNAEGDCDADGQLNGVDPHDDDDLLDDALEMRLKLDPCKADTDGDGVQDGYEYRSARDLNDDEDEEPNTFLPYPGKRPYPNPLFADDANTDFDGDTLTLEEEHALWNYSVARGEVRSLDALSYSDGEQYTRSVRGADGRRRPTLPALGYAKHQCFLDWADVSKQDSCITGEVEHGYLTVALQDPEVDWFQPRTFFDIRDFNRDGAVAATPVGAIDTPELTYYDHQPNGWLSDDERDEDADGLTNFQEARNCMQPGYWKSLYNLETPYYRTYSDTDLADEDSDGDGVRDGADDQDNDDVPNLMECSRNSASGRPYDPRVPPPPSANPAPLKGFVDPFNPCKPSIQSRTCNNKPSLSAPWGPFNAEDKNYFVWN